MQNFFQSAWSFYYVVLIMRTDDLKSSSHECSRGQRILFSMPHAQYSGINNRRVNNAGGIRNPTTLSPVCQSRQLFGWCSFRR
jgi:hypothetical protein